MIHRQFDKKNNTKTSNFGFATLLLCFTMICIITFSVLSLITANSDWILSKKVSKNNATYHEVEVRSCEHIADIDAMLATSFNNSDTKDNYFQQVSEHLQNQSGLISSGEDGIYYQFENELSDSQSLNVTLYITYPTTSTTSFYQVTQWQVVTDTSVEIDDTLNLMK